MFPAVQIPGNEHECDLDAPCPTCGNQQSPQPLISNCDQGCSSAPQSKEPFGSGHCPRVKIRPPPPKKESSCRKPESPEKKVGPTPETCKEPCDLDCAGGGKKNESCQERANKGAETPCGVKKCPNKFEKPDYCGMLAGKPKPPCKRTKFDDDGGKKPFKMACGPKEGLSCCHNKGDAFKKKKDPGLPKDKPIPNPCGNKRIIDPNNPCEMYGGNPCKRKMEGKKCSTSCQDRLRKAACAGCDKFNTNKIEEYPTVCPCQQKPKKKRPPCKKNRGGDGDDGSGFCASKKKDRCAMIEDPIRKKRCEAYANMKFDKVDPDAGAKKKPGRTCPKKDDGGCPRKPSDEAVNRKTTCPCCEDRHDELTKKKPSTKKGPSPPPPTEYVSPCKRRAAENEKNKSTCGRSRELEGKFCCGGEGCAGGENGAGGGNNADGGPCAAMKSQPSPEIYNPPPSKGKSRKGSKQTNNEGPSCPNAAEPPFACAMY